MLAALSGGLVYTLSTVESVGVTSTPLTLATGVSNQLVLTTTGPSDVWVCPVSGGSAFVNQGVYVPGGGGSAQFGRGGYPLPTGTIAAIVNGPTAQGLAMAGG